MPEPSAPPVVLLARRLAHLRGFLVECGASPSLVKEFEQTVRDDERQAFVEKVKRYL